MRKLLLQATLPPYDRREILRYAGAKEGNAELQALLENCLAECEGIFTPRAIGCAMTKAELFELVDGARESEGLQSAVEGGEEVLLFAATVGVEIDRKILRTARISPAKALLFQAIGAERIEGLCEELRREYRLGRRFSAGYGDFPLSAQKSIFQILNCPKEIGLTLTEGLVMSPTKSVTAIAVMGKTPCKSGCEACQKEDCAYRK